jgi:hypothetical protein
MAVHSASQERARLLVSFAVVTVLFAMMFKWLPDISVAWRDVWLVPLSPPCFSRWEGSDRLLHRQAGPGIDLRCGGLDRRRADLGLLHVADHPDGRGGNRKAPGSSCFEDAPPISKSCSVIREDHSGKIRMTVPGASRRA